MWIKNSFRRHLLDMHIADWQDGKFLSEFSPEEYFENLKRANVKSAMIYLQSHIGYCYFPTKTGEIHSAFKDNPDSIKRLVQLCRSNGIDVIAYYSINYNTLERNKHIDWSVVKRDVTPKSEDFMFTGSRYGLCCPINPDYMQFILDQTTEILEYAEFDGIFYDMPFLPLCYCEHCKARYKKETGLDIPTNIQSAEMEAFLLHQASWTEDYISRITKHAKKLKPNITVQYNYALAVLDLLTAFEVLNEYQDYASGDLYVGFLTQSFACKFYNTVTKNKPFEYMTGRCDPNLAVHTITKSFDKLRLAMMLTLAHHGANFVIDAIDPVGTMDERFYELLGELYKEVEFYEPYLKTGELVADVGLMYVMEARSNLLSGKEKPKNCHYNAVLSAAKTLIQSHIPFNVFSQATIKNLNQYKVIIIPNPKNLNANTIFALKEYINNGGSLYISGAAQPELLELIGSEFISYTEQKNTYLAPKKQYEALFADFNAKYPLAFSDEQLPIIKNVDDESVLATITLPFINPELPNAFASIHSNPPGTATSHPAVVIKKVGKGTVLWVAPVIEAMRPLAYQKILLNLLGKIGLQELSVKTTANRGVELITFADDDKMLVSAVYVTDDDITEVQRPFEISVRSNKPKKVILLRNNEEIQFNYNNGYTIFETKELNIFDMYLIEY